MQRQLCIVTAVFMVVHVGCGASDEECECISEEDPTDTPVSETPEPSPVEDVSPTPHITDIDEDGWTVERGDCDDENADINPSILETCDFVDNDCDNEVDENYPIYPYYRDSDGDNYPGTTDVEDTVYACRPPEGFTDEMQLDCNDNDSVIYPGATDICDGDDTDCDGADCPLFFAPTNVSVECSPSSWSFFLSLDGSAAGTPTISVFDNSLWYDEEPVYSETIELEFDSEWPGHQEWHRLELPTVDRLDAFVPNANTIFQCQYKDFLTYRFCAADYWYEATSVCVAVGAEPELYQ